MVNPQKHTLFDMETRVAIAKKTVEHLPRVRVIADTGMLIDLFDRLGADAVCKGYRNQKDYDYEMEMARWNEAHNPRFRTVLYPAADSLRSISSTEVRTRLQTGEGLTGLVHPKAVPMILEQMKLD
jgi:pantetheine-phosphate adenylyltransferase